MERPWMRESWESGLGGTSTSSSASSVRQRHCHCHRHHQQHQSISLGAPTMPPGITFPFQFCCFFSCCSWWLCSFSAPFPFHFATLLCTRTRLKISHSYRVRHCRWFKQGCKPVLNRFNWTEPAASLKGKMNGKLCWIYKVIRNLIII